VRDVGAEEPGEALLGDGRVLEDVVEEPSGDASSSFISASVIATASGWTRYGSPEERSWLRCSCAETTYARRSRSTSKPGW
jgi:hypothetical protein